MIRLGPGGDYVRDWPEPSHQSSPPNAAPTLRRRSDAPSDGGSDPTGPPSLRLRFGWVEIACWVVLAAEALRLLNVGH
ncbi:MAG: hypothetical protein AABZ12_00255 [Planctomycetota bacterium]